MSSEIIVIGAGAQARVVFDILSASGKAADVTAFVDLENRGELTGQTVHGCRVIEGIDAFCEYARSHPVTVYLGHGNNSRRKDVFPILESLSVDIATAVHPSAIISPDVKVGPGTVISAGVIIITGAEIGKGCIINTAATVDHDCRVGDFSQIAPGANLAGRVTIGQETFIGIGACVIQNVSIGDGSVVGAGAAVVREVPARCLVIGVPARVRKKL